MNKLLNNLLGMYKQAKLNKKAEEVVYDSDLIAQVLSMTKNQKEDEFSIVTLSPEKDKVLGVKYIKKDEVYDYKPNQNEYALVMTRDTGFADTDYQLQPMIMVVRSWNEGRKFYATKKNRLNKKAEEKESAKKDYTEQYAKVKEIMKEYGYGLSDGGYIYLISKEEPKDEGFQVKFKGDRLRVELDGKLKYSGYGPEAIEDFLKGMFYAKKLSSKAKAFRKLCLKRAFHKTAGEFEEMMKLKSTDPKLISYLAKEFGVEESTVSQYTDVSENAEELYNILEQQANKYGYEWDKFEYDEYGDRIDEDDFRGDPDDLEKAVEYLKNNIDKTMFKFEYVGKYEDNYLTFSVVSEKLIPTERPVIYITHNTKNYDISLFVQTKESKEQDKAEGIESDNSLTILIRRTSDEILNEIVNYVNVELPKKIEEQNKKQSSKAKLVRKQAENKEIVVTYEGTNGKEYIVKAPNGLYFNEYVDTDTQYSRGAGPFETLEKAKEMFKKHRPSAKEVVATKKKAGIDPNVSAEEIVKLNFDMPIEKADKVKEQFNEKGIKYQSRKGKYTVEFSVDIEAAKVDLVYEIIRNIKKLSSTKKQAVLQESENGLGYVLPNGQVVYPEDEAYLKSEYKANKQMLEKDKKELERLEGIIKKYPDINFDKNRDSVKFQIPRVKKGIEYLELFNETIEDILNAFKNKKIGKQATIKHENGVYNVYSESGKCLGKGYKTKEEAEKRLKQVEYFKHKNASVIKKAKNLSEIDGDAEFMSDLEIGNGMPYNSDDYDYFEVYKIHAKNPKDTYNNKYVVVSDNGSILAVREKEEDIIEITYDDMLQELRWRRLSNRKTQPNKRTSLKQVEYFKNKKAVTGTDYWGPKEIPDEEEEGTFIIRYYGGPGHIDYLRKSRNGKYHWVEQTHFDYINDKPFETTDYELAKKLVEQYGGEIEKKESKQVNNKRTSLKQVVISKMAKIKK